MKLEKRYGEKYYLDTVIKGRRIRRALHGDKAIARQMAKEIIKAETSKTFTSVKKAKKKIKIPTTHELIEKFVKDKISMGNLAERTNHRYKTTQKSLEKNFPNKPIVNLTECYIKRHFEKRIAAGKANSTLNKELAIIKNICKIAIKKEFIKIDPSVELQYYPKEMGPIIYFKKNEIDLIMKNAKIRERTLYSVYLYTGLRKMETARFAIK